MFSFGLTHWLVVNAREILSIRTQLIKCSKGQSFITLDNKLKEDTIKLCSFLNSWNCPLSSKDLSLAIKEISTIATEEWVIEFNAYHAVAFIT